MNLKLILVIISAYISVLCIESWLTPESHPLVQACPGMGSPSERCTVNSRDSARDLLRDLLAYGGLQRGCLGIQGVCEDYIRL